METSCRIIDTLAELEKAASEFEREKAVAVDLEADSMYHFKEKVCLVQIATEELPVMVDPLMIKDLSPLKPLFSNPGIRKVFHGADYDIRSLYRDFNICVNNLFDTELACRFLGLKESGLQAVLKMFFNIDIDKKYQKKDWSKRPLPKEMTAYASKDVMHLLPLAEILTRQLEEIGRLDWVREECDDLAKVRPELTNEGPLFLKFKGAGRLKSRSLAVLEALLQFRKRVAEEKDRPLFKIISNDSMAKIATVRPVTLRHLKRINTLSDKQMLMYGHDVIQAVAGALEIPDDELPVCLSKKPPVLPRGAPKRIKALKTWRASTARTLKIHPGMLCNNALITAAAVNNPVDENALDAIAGMKQWQKKVFGKEIVRALKKVSKH
jgi:ribonuclease D